MSFALQSIADKDAMQAFLVNGISRLEEVTARSGFRFFKGVDVTERNALWPVTGRWPGPLTSRCKPSYLDK